MIINPFFFLSALCMTIAGILERRRGGTGLPFLSIASALLIVSFAAGGG